MAGLYFTVGADFSKLQKLKRDIENLKTQLRSMDQAANPKEFARLEKQLAQLSREFDREAVAAQRAGAMTAKAGKDASMAAGDFDKLKKASMMVGGTAGLFALGREIKNVRGEIEYLEKSFEVLLGGSKAKADALIQSMKQITLKSNYSLTDLSSGAQTLLGFNVDEKQIIPVLEQIGNIAMGNTDRFKSLNLAFAQMSSTGKLMGQDLLQMINAGFNPLSVISEKTGKSIGDLKKEMESGGITVEMVTDAFRSAATEGGKFAGMMESQADSIKGAEAKLSGAIQDAFNDVGDSHSELIKGGYDVATSLVQNYQTVGEVLAGLIATYGLYKTAIITTNAIKPVMLAQTYEAQAAALTKLLNGEQAHRISQLGLVQGSAEHVAAIRAEITATAESAKVKLQEEQINLQTLRTKRAEAEQTWMTARAKTEAAKQELASAIATAQAEAEASLQKKMAIESEKQSRAALRIVKLQEQKDAAIAQATALKEKGASDEKIAAKNKEITSIQAKIVAARQEEIQHGRNVAAMRAEIKAGVNYSANKNVQTLSNKVNTLSEKENAAATAHSGYIKQMVGSKVLIKKLATQADTAATVADTAATTSNAVATNILTAAKTRLITVAKNLWAVLAPNPYLLAAAAVVALGYGIFKLATYQTEAEKAQSRLNKTVAEFTKETAAEQAEINRLFDKLRNTNKESENYQKVKDEIISKYGNYLEGLRTEIRTLNDVEAAYRAISAAAKQSAIDRAIANTTKDAQDSYAEQVQKINTNLKKELQKKMTTGAADAFLETINMELKKTGKLSDKTREKIKEFNYEIFHPETGEKIDSGNSVEFWLNKMSANKTLLDKTYKNIQQQFGISVNEYEGLGEEQINSYIKGFEKAISNFNQSGNNQAIELGGKWITFGSEEELNLHLKKLKDVRNNFDKNIDTSPSKNKAYWENIKKEAEGARDALDEAEKGGERWLELNEAIKNAENKVKLWESPTKAGSAGESAAEKALKQAKDYKKAKEKQSLEEIRAVEDLEIQINEAEIKAMDEGSKKVLAQMELDHKKEMLALERQKEDALKTKRDNARALFEADPNNKGKAFDDSVIKLSEEELQNYRDLQTKQTENFEREKYNMELQYMRDYIKEFGTYQQKKLAIAQEYDKKIAASANEYERKSLESQKQATIKNVDFGAISKRIDWQGVFGNMTGMLESQLKETLSGLKEYVKTDQFKASSETDKKTVYDAIEKLRSTTPGGDGTLNFNVIRQQMDDLGAAINDLQTATLNEKTAYDDLAKAQEKYESALKTGNQTLIESSKQNLDAAKISANEASIAYKKAEANVEGLGNTFKETATDTVDGLNLVADGLGDFASNSLPQIFKGLQNTVTGLSKLDIGGKVGDAIGSLSKALGKADIIGQLIGAILSILDVLKDGIGTLVASLIDTVLNAVDGILSNLLSGDIFIQIGNSLKNGISNILNTISFGGFNSLISSIGGSNAKEVQESIERLTTRNETLGKSIDRLTDVMDKVAGAESLSAYDQAYKYQKERNDNLLQISREQARYSGSHHSWQYYMKWSNEQIKWAQENVDKNFSGTGSMWELTPDQMSKLLSNDSIYEQINNAGKGGYGGRVMEKLEAYADQAGNLEELTNKINESLMQISFDGLRSSFLDSLMDMDKDAKSFSEDFSEYMQRALMNFAMGELFDEELKTWYNGIADLMKDQSGKLTAEQLENARREYEDMAQRAMDTRDEIASLTGYTGKDSSSSQQASKGVYQGMSQDTGDRLEARNTAIHMETIKIGNNIITMSADVRNMTTQMIRFGELTEQSLHHMEEIKTIQLNSYYELKDINNNTKELYQMNERIGEMNDKLSRL